MKCERVIVYYSRGKPIAYSMLLAGAERPAALPGLTAAETSFARAYTRFPAIRERWNPDGTPNHAATIPDDTVGAKGS